MSVGGERHETEARTDPANRTSTVAQVGAPATEVRDVTGSGERVALADEAVVPRPVGELDHPDPERRRHAVDERAELRDADRPHLDLDRGTSFGHPLQAG